MTAKHSETLQGRTPVPELSKLHVDVRRLDYVRLGKVAQRVAGAIEGGRYTRLTKARVTKLLTEAVKQARVDPTGLSKNIPGGYGRGRAEIERDDE